MPGVGDHKYSLYLAPEPYDKIQCVSLIDEHNLSPNACWRVCGNIRIWETLCSITNSSLFRGWTSALIVLWTAFENHAGGVLS